MKRIFAGILGCGLLLAGCGSDGELPSVRRGEEGFQLGSLAWGSAPEEVEEALGVTLPEPMEGESGGASVYALQEVRQYGAEGTLLLYFRDGLLEGADFTEEGADEERFQSLLDDFREEYGRETGQNETDSALLGRQVETLDYRWDDPATGTVLFLALSAADGGEPSLTVSVSKTE